MTDGYEKTITLKEIGHRSQKPYEISNDRKTLTSHQSISKRKEDKR